MFGCDYLEKVSFVSAFEQAGSSFGILDQFVFRLFKLQSIHEFSGIDIPRIEQELVGGNGEQRFGQLLHLRQQKILDVLTGQNDRGFLFPHALHGVSDIFNCRLIGEE